MVKLGKEFSITKGLMYKNQIATCLHYSSTALISATVMKDVKSMLKFINDAEATICKMISAHPHLREKVSLAACNMGTP